VCVGGSIRISVWNPRVLLHRDIHQLANVRHVEPVLGCRMALRSDALPIRRRSPPDDRQLRPPHRLRVRPDAGLCADAARDVRRERQAQEADGGRRLPRADRRSPRHPLRRLLRRVDLHVSRLPVLQLHTTHADVLSELGGPHHEGRGRILTTAAAVFLSLLVLDENLGRVSMTLIHSDRLRHVCFNSDLPHEPVSTSLPPG